MGTKSAWNDERKAAARQRMTKPGTAERRRLWAVWSAMQKRCFDPNHKDYKHYGARGISVCQRWMSFKDFLSDVEPRPVGGQIERINNNGDYEPSNFRWANKSEQARNQRGNRMLAFKGKVRPLIEISEMAGIDYSTLRARLNLGWSLGRSVSEPVMKMTRQSIVINGESMSLKKACSVVGVSYTAALKRVASGWDIDDVITKPMRPDRRRSR